ncbi:MAG: hypothetical protein QXP77_02135 [Candidatus Aenigmatarchaeota archaeon]
MKGQAFIILSIFLVLILFLVKNLSSSLNLEKEIEEFEFKNLKEEVSSVALFSFQDYSNISKNIEDFLRFSRNSFSSRGKIFNCFFLGVYYQNITENEQTDLNITVLNLLGHELKILNITFSYDDSSKIFYSIQDGEKIQTSFSFNISSSSNCTLKIFSFNYENWTEKIEIPLEIGKSKFIGFFSMSLENRIRIRDKFSEQLNLR